MPALAADIVNFSPSLTVDGSNRFNRTFAMALAATVLSLGAGSIKDIRPHNAHGRPVCTGQSTALTGL
jgi:hypothetical protein